MKTTAVYALTPAGARLGARIALSLDGDLFLPRRLAPRHGAEAFESLREAVDQRFNGYRRHVFVAAVGIVVRVITPHLSHKLRDPAVVALDQGGRYVVSVLSGHVGGANDLARQVAGLTGGEPVITTATDTAGVPAIDRLACQRGCAIQNPAAIKQVNMALLEGEPIQAWDPEGRLDQAWTWGPGSTPERVKDRTSLQRGRPGVCVTWGGCAPPDPECHLVLHPRCLVVGVGCNRGTPAAEVRGLIEAVFTRHGLSLQAVKCLATIEAKRDEAGILQAAAGLAVPVELVGPDVLRGVDAPHPSEVVARCMGVPSVCEASAIAVSRGGQILVGKTKGRNVTVAVALEASGW